MANTIPDRANILKGPAKLVWDTATILFGDDFTVDCITTWADVMSSSHGRIGRRVENRYIEIKGRPLMWDTLTKLFPYATHQVGDVLFGATDKSAVITPRNGAPLTITNVMPTQLPGIDLHPVRPMLDTMTFTGLCALSSDPSLLASYYAFGTPGAAVALSGLDYTKIFNGVYTGAYNGVTYRPVDGFRIDFNLGLEPDLDNGLAINMRVTEHEAACKFTPGPHTEAALATLMGWNTIGPGDDAPDYSLVISGHAAGKPTVTLANMMVESGGVRYGRAPRGGEVTMQSVRQEAAGVLTALYAFASVV